MPVVVTAVCHVLRLLYPGAGCVGDIYGTTQVESTAYTGINREACQCQPLRLQECLASG